MPGGDDAVAVCVDAGTTVLKAVVFDRHGRELVVARRETAIDHPAWDRCEQDMAQVWRATVDVVREAHARAGGTVRLLAITAQGDGAWPVDADGRPTRPAVLWNDGRAAALVRGWQRDGVLAAAFARNGSLGNAGLPHAVLRVLADREPEVIERTSAVLTCGGWLWWRLTGQLGIDRSDASAPWLDIRAGTYSDELLALYGLSGLARLRPPLLEESDRVRGLGAGAAAELGLPAGLPVVLAPYDVGATALGAGTTGGDEAVAVLGTTLCVASMSTGPEPGEVAAGLTLDLGLGHRYLRAFPTLAGTGVVDWAARLLGTHRADLFALAEGVPPGADGLLLLPYLSPAGERAPFLDTTARGLLDGLRLDHQPRHIARAVLEGLAHVLRDCLDALPRPPALVRLCGGGAASDSWCRTITDLAGVDTVRCADTQVGAKGALVVAATLLGEYPDLAAATTALVGPGDRLRPDPSVRERYERAHHRFLDTRARISPGWHGRVGAGSARV